MELNFHEINLFSVIDYLIVTSSEQQHEAQVSMTMIHWSYMKLKFQWRWFIEVTWSSSFNDSLKVV
jgi:hypothetical protein